MAGSSVEIILDKHKLEELIRDCKGKPTRILHDGVHYGIYQEFGTSRGVPPHPFMTPALEAVREPFRRGLQQIANLRRGEAFVEKVARDAERIAKSNAPVDTGALRASIMVSRPERFQGLDE